MDTIKRLAALLLIYSAAILLTWGSIVIFMFNPWYLAVIPVVLIVGLVGYKMLQQIGYVIVYAVPVLLVVLLLVLLTSVTSGR